MNNDPDERVEEGSSNVFADLGFPDPRTHLLKAQLVTRIRQRMEAEGLTDIEAAKRLGIEQTVLSRVLDGRFRDCSVERLLRFLAALGCDIEIVVRTENEPRTADAIPVQSGMA